MSFGMILSPLLIILLEFTAIAASLAYARYAAELGHPVVGILGGLIKIGGRLPFEAVPGAVVVLHLVALAAGVFFWASYVAEPLPKADVESEPMPPQEG